MFAYAKQQRGATSTSEVTPGVAPSRRFNPAPQTIAGSTVDFSRVSILRPSPPAPHSGRAALALGSAHDSAEQEADRVAGEVTRIPWSTASNGGVPAGPSVAPRFGDAAASLPAIAGPAFASPRIQRACAACTDDERIQRVCSACGAQPRVAPDTVAASAPDEDRVRAPGWTSVAISNDVATLRRKGGTPLSAELRDALEPRFGYNLGHVRLHAEPQAAALSQRLSARAFTVGSDVFFNHGEFSPGTQAGRRLLAHELVHTIQQHRGAAPATIRRKEMPAAPSALPPVASPMPREMTEAGAGSRSGSTPPRRRGALPQELTSTVSWLTSEIVRDFRDHPRDPSDPPSPAADRENAARPAGRATGASVLESRARAARLGREFGLRVGKLVDDSPQHPLWQQLAFGPAAANRDLTEVDEPGDPDDPTLLAVNGITACNLALGLPYILVTNLRCTAPCTLLHESTHFWDILPCCVRAGIAYRAAPVKSAVVASWGAWIGSNRAAFECKAYRVSQTCGAAVSAAHACFAPPALVGALIVTAAAAAGALIGSQALGAAGTVAGGATGLAGGPAAPVTVPVGAAAGFISGELLGFIGGFSLGAAAGAAVEALRRKCCDDVANYRRTAAAKIASYCGGPPATPCPF